MLYSYSSTTIFSSAQQKWDIFDDFSTQRTLLKGDLASLLQVGRFWHIALESLGRTTVAWKQRRLILIMTFYFLLTVKNFQQCIQFRGKLPRSVVVATFSIYAHFLCIWSLRECCTVYAAL